MRRGILIVTGLAIALAPLPAAAQSGGSSVTFVETFETGGNEGGWSFGNAFESITQDGARSGYFLRNVFLDSIAASPATQPGVASVFTGDYRARGVSLVGLDFRLFRVDFTAQGRDMAVILINDSGTPQDGFDDCGVYAVGPKALPHPGRVWKSFDFVVPAALPVMPPQWSRFGDCGAMTDDEVWNHVITDVDQVRFFGGDPALIYIFQVWDVGLDNPRITFADPGTTEPLAARN